LAAQTNAERAFLGVAEYNGAVRGLHGELAIDNAEGIIAAKGEGLLFFGDGAAARIAKGEARANGGAIGLRLVDRLHTTVGLLAVVLEVLREDFFAPEIEAVDIAVAEIERALVRLEVRVVWIARGGVISDGKRSG